MRVVVREMALNMGRGQDNSTALTEKAVYPSLNCKANGLKVWMSDQLLEASISMFMLLVEKNTY